MYKMKNNTVEMVSVEWIMQNANHSVDGFDDYNGGVDYLQMMLEKGDDGQFADLCGAIDKEGFRIPIVLVKNYCGHSITHGNGHHRMCAAILLGMDEIPVFWSDYEWSMDYMCEESSEGGDIRDFDGEYEFDIFMEFAGI